MKKTTKRTAKPQPSDKKLRLVREIVNVHLNQVVGGNGVAAKKEWPTCPCHAK